MLSPQDPEAFRARVLRRAVQIERRRRRARVLMAVPAVIAVVLAVVVVADRGQGTSNLAAGEAGGAITSQVVDLPLGGEPWAVVGGSDGSVWLLRHGDPATLTSFEGGVPASTFELPAGATPDAIVAGTDEAIWMTAPDASQVIRVAADGTQTTWPTESPPSASTTWLGGRFWYAEPALDRITGISAEGDVVHHDVPRGRAPSVLAAGPDGAVWYASSTAARVGSVSGSGNVNEIDLGRADERATTMSPGPGPALWMVLSSPSGTRLAHVDAQGRVVGEDIAVDREPKAISTGPDGRLWFSAGNATLQQRSLSRLTVRELGRPVHADSWALVTDDSMWAVDRGLRVVLRITVE